METPSTGSFMHSVSPTFQPPVILNVLAAGEICGHSELGPGSFTASLSHTPF